MPFLGKLDGATVLPEEVSEPVSCLECGGELRIRDSHERDGSFVARHFFHYRGRDGCSGGESDTHRQLKSIALSKLKHEFDSRESGLERKFGDNVADVYALLDEPSDRFGRGIVVEIQYRNEGKDIEAATQNYHDEGLSVYWVDESDFEGKDLDLGSTTFESLWANKVPPESEWTGRHGVIRWLEQDKDAPVEIEIPFPNEPRRRVREWRLEHAWWRGHRQSTADDIPVVVTENPVNWNPLGGVSFAGTFDKSPKLRLKQSPSGSVVLQLNENYLHGGGDTITFEIHPGDVDKLLEFTVLTQLVFEKLNGRA